MRRRTVRVVATAAMAATLVGGFGDSVLAETRRVRMKDNFFRPRRIEINKGDRVRWVNRGDNTHTSTSNSGLWDSGLVMPGEAFTKRFRRRGIFRYHCKIHDGMTGKVVVG